MNSLLTTYIRISMEAWVGGTGDDSAAVRSSRDHFRKHFPGTGTFFGLLLSHWSFLTDLPPYGNQLPLSLCPLFFRARLFAACGDYASPRLQLASPPVMLLSLGQFQVVEVVVISGSLCQAWTLYGQFRRGNFTAEPGQQQCFFLLVPAFFCSHFFSKQSPEIEGLQSEVNVIRYCLETV